MRYQSANEHDEGEARCDVCRRPLAHTQSEALSSYWAIMHDGQLTRLCCGCHDPDDGGVYVVVPVSHEDRWVPLLSGRAYL